MNKIYQAIIIISCIGVIQYWFVGGNDLELKRIILIVSLVVLTLAEITNYFLEKRKKKQTKK